MPYAEVAPGRSLEVRTEKWVQNGFCLAHTQDGLPVFVHGALPGERLRVELVKERSAHAFAVVDEVLEARKGRRPTDCVAFPRCGGCSFRHISYEDEIALKHELLGELKYVAPLRELPGFEIVTGDSDGYRRNVRLQSDGREVGFFGLHTNRLVPLPEDGCRQASPFINEAIAAMRQGREQAASAEPELVYRDRDQPDWGEPPGSFSQSNRHLIGPWLELLRDWLSEPIDTTELFCGSGIIGGNARDRIGRYRGYDNDAVALRFARTNFKRRAHMGDFERADLYRRVPELTSPRVIANPPRKGLGRDLVAAVAAGAREVLYSSCNPHTLDRDLAEFERRGFRPMRAVGFDFFPRTPHLELVVLLHKTEGQG